MHMLLNMQSIAVQLLFNPMDPCHFFFSIPIIMHLGSRTISIFYFIFFLIRY